MTHSDSSLTHPILVDGEVQTVFKNPYLSIETSDVVFNPSQKKGKYSVVKSGTGRGVVVILMRRVRGLTYINCVKQYRFPIKSETVEFPRGGADLNEDYLDAAKREVAEETGIQIDAKHLNLLGIIHPDTGLLSTEVAVYTAFISEEHNLEAPWVEAETGARAAWYQSGDFMGAMSRGKVTDAMTLAAWALFQNSNANRMDFI